jgi:hypothetical protein
MPAPWREPRRRPETRAFPRLVKSPRLIDLEEWPPRSGRPRVLVEDPDGAVLWASARILEEAGYDVACCQGPTPAGGGVARTCCPLLTGGACPLVEGADVVVSTTSLPESAEILEAVASHRAPLVVAGPERVVCERVEPIGAGTALPFPVTTEKLVGAVAAALEEPRAT